MKKLKMLRHHRLQGLKLIRCVTIWQNIVVKEFQPLNLNFKVRAYKYIAIPMTKKHFWKLLNLFVKSVFIQVKLFSLGFRNN